MNKNPKHLTFIRFAEKCLGLTPQPFHLELLNALENGTIRTAFASKRLATPQINLVCSPLHRGKSIAETLYTPKDRDVDKCKTKTTWMIIDDPIAENIKTVANSIDSIISVANQADQEIGPFSHFDIPIVTTEQKELLSDEKMQYAVTEEGTVSYKEKDGVTYIFDIEVKKEK